MKNLPQYCRRCIQTFLFLFALLLLQRPGYSQPALPTLPVLDTYSFSETNWPSGKGYAPIAFTNLVAVPEFGGTSLLLDTTNDLPAYLAYNIVETNGHTNLDFPTGAILCVFICDWASADTNQNGAGLGEVGYLLSAGDFSSGSPEGLWSVYFDAGGTNIYFGGISNSESTVFVSAPISWPSNSIHLIGISYTTNTELYIDGQLAATGNPVTIVPSTSVWTNGFFVGSDNMGYEQARGVFFHLDLEDSNLLSVFSPSFFTNGWSNLYNNFASSQGGGAGFASGTTSSLHSVGGSGGCTTGTNVYMTDMSYAVVSGQNTFTFTIAGGTNGVYYDLFATTNLFGTNVTNAIWTWLGQGTNCGIYSVTNQPNTQSFYVLGTPVMATNGFATAAYEALIPSWDYADPNNPGLGLLNVTIISPAQGTIIQ